MGLRDDPQIATARRLRDQIKAEAKAMTDSGNLTPQGVKEAMKDKVDAVNRQMESLKAAYCKGAAEKRQAIESEALDLPAALAAGVIERRDAIARAESLVGPSDASKLLRHGIRSNDPSLTAEVVRKAVARGWSDTLDVYTESFPERAAAVERMQAAGDAGKWGDSVVSSTAFRPVRL